MFFFEVIKLHHIWFSNGSVAVLLTALNNLSNIFQVFLTFVIQVWAKIQNLKAVYAAAQRFEAIKIYVWFKKKSPYAQQANWLSKNKRFLFN